MAAMAEEVRAFLPAAPAGGAAFIELTPRERELVELIAQGLDMPRLRLALRSARRPCATISPASSPAPGRKPLAGDVLARDAGFGKKTRNTPLGQQSQVFRARWRLFAPSGRRSHDAHRTGSDNVNRRRRKSAAR